MNWRTALLALAAGSALAIFAAGLRLPALPAALSVDAPADRFSAARAHRHIQAIAGEPRPSGSAALLRARNYIQNEVRAIAPGMELETQQRLMVESFLPGIATGTRIENIIARVPGRDPDSARPILLLAHYDSAANSPGANDDGAGVAVLLELLRTLLAQNDGGFRNDLVLLFTDGEERGLLGARAYIRHHPSYTGPDKDREAQAIVLNFEARGSSGPALMFQTGPQSDWLVRAFARSAPGPVASSIAPELFRLLPYGTDFQAFARAGHAGLNFAYINNTLHYHTPQDTPASVDPRSLQHHGENVLELLRDLLQRDFGSDAEAPAARGALSQSPGRFLAGVNYLPTPFGLLVYASFWNALGLALAWLFWLLCFSPQLRDLSFARAALQLSYPLGLFVAAAIAVALVWQLVLVCVPELRATLFTGETYRPGGIKTGLQLVGLCVAGGLVLRWNRGRSKAEVLAMGLGGLLLAGSLAVCFAPGAAYFFVLPTIAVLFVAGPMLYFAGSGESQKVALALCVPGLWVIALVCGPLVRLLGFGLLGVSAQPVALLVYVPWLFLLSVLLGEGTRARRWCVPGLAVLSAICLVWGVQRAAFSAEQPRPNSVFYAIDGDSGSMTRFSCDARLDSWTRGLVGAGTSASEGTGSVGSVGSADRPAAPANLNEFLPVLRRCLPGFNPVAGRRAENSVDRAALPAPVVTERSRRAVDGAIVLRLAVQSPRGAPRLYAFARPHINASESAFALRAVRVDGVAVPDRALSLSGGSSASGSVLRRLLGWFSGNAFAPDDWLGLLLTSASAAPSAGAAVELEFELVPLESPEASGQAAAATGAADSAGPILELWVLDHSSGLPADLQPGRPDDTTPGGRHPFSDGVFVLTRSLF